MTADNHLNVVVLGAGALGLGFIGPELTPHCRITYLDIPAKADLLAASARPAPTPSTRPASPCGRFASRASAA